MMHRSLPQLKVKLAILAILKFRRATYRKTDFEWIYRAEVCRKAKVSIQVFDEVIRELTNTSSVEFLTCIDRQNEWWAFRLLPQGETMLLQDVKPFLDAAGELL